MDETWKGWEWLQWGVIGAMFITAAVRWGSVPDQIPIHWNAAGEVDGYGGRFSGLLLLPLIALGLYLLLRYIPRIDPARANYENFARTYLTIRIVFLVYMAFIYFIMNLAIANEENVAVDKFIIGAIAVMFLILGGAMGKFRPNWFVGIRTPWTLSSKRSWVKTHRAGGWVFIASGVAMLAAAFVDGELAIYVMLGVLLVGIIGLVVYSYVVWRDDPDKVSAQETAPAE